MSEEFMRRRHEIVMAKFLERKVRYISVEKLRELLKDKMDLKGQHICYWCGEPVNEYAKWCRGHGTKFWSAYCYNHILYCYRKNHKFCEVCGKERTAEIHHKTPIAAEGGGGHPLDETNLIALCRECHLKMHKDYKVTVFHKTNPPLEEYV